MKIIFENINWIAVGVASIIYSAFSGIWHRQFAFGKKWEIAMGFKRPDQWKETNIYYIVPSISCFTTAVAISIILKLIGITDITEALTLGILLGVGFAMTVTFTNAVIPTMKKPLVFGAITGASHAIGITLATITIYLISR